MFIRPFAVFVVLLLSPGLTSPQAPQETPGQASLRIRRTDGENRALFRSDEPLRLTLEANFGPITRDRNPESTAQYPGLLKIDDGSGHSIPVQLSARGHLRRKACDFIPLRVEFSKPEAKGTLFEMPAAALKLVTHCIDAPEYDQLILKEYLAYRILNVVTPRSFRARLARVAYVEANRNKTRATRYGILLEDDDDVARRLEGRVQDRPNVPFIRLHPVALAQMMIFEFMIGNTDFSIIGQHNVVIVEQANGLIYPIPYDFDVSGLVRAPYGAPDPRIHLRDVTQRLYRGPCRTPEQMDAMLQTFRVRKPEILKVVDSQPDLKSLMRREMKNYLEGFFSLISKPSSVKDSLIKPCIKSGV